MRSALRPILASVATALFAVALPLNAFQSPLSEESVREAYFLGQRTDGSASKFFEGYRHYLPAPHSGPHVAIVEIWTPFAQAVDVSRRQGAGYSAQQAQRDYRAHEDRLRIGVHVNYTATYGPGFPYSPNKVPGATGTWKDFQVRFVIGGTALDTQKLRYEGRRVGSGRYGSRPTGFTIWLDYNAGSIASSNAIVQIETPDGQHVATAFDLSALR